MAFVKFTETGKSFAARASISPRGMLSFNDGARRKYKLDQYKFCVLYYDAEAKLVGVELTNDEQASGAIKLRIRTTGADLGAKSFIDFFEIAPKNTCMYDIRQGESEEWVIIDLTTARERKKSGAEEDDDDDFIGEPDTT